MDGGTIEYFRINGIRRILDTEASVTGARCVVHGHFVRTGLYECKLLFAERNKKLLFVPEMPGIALN